MKNKIISATIFLFVGLKISIATAGPPREEISGVTVNTSYATAFRITDSNFRDKSFNDSIKKADIKGEILKCSSLVDLPGGENHSYGGLCVLEKTNTQSEVVICNAEMTNAFEIKEYSTPISTQELIDFVSSNCYGG